MLWSSVCFFFSAAFVVVVVIIAGVIWASILKLVRTWFTHVLFKFTCANHYGKSAALFSWQRPMSVAQPTTNKMDRNIHGCCNFCSSIRNVDKLIEHEDGPMSTANAWFWWNQSSSIDSIDRHHQNHKKTCYTIAQFHLRVQFAATVARDVLISKNFDQVFCSFVRLPSVSAWFLIQWFFLFEWWANTVRNFVRRQLVKC